MNNGNQRGFFHASVLLRRVFRFLPYVRYKLWRASCLILLGRTAGRGLQRSVIRSLDEVSNSPTISIHIVDRRKLAGPRIVSYSFPEAFPDCFPRHEAFPERFAYHLRDVALSPKTGFVWLPRHGLLQQSMGSIPRLYSDSVCDLMQPLLPLSLDCPVVVLPNVSYYHCLVEGFPQVLHAFHSFPDAAVLLENNHSPVLDQMLDIARISQDKRFFARGPVLAKNAILVPRWVNGGFVPPEDIEVLQNSLLRDISGTASGDKIYISRANSPNRRLLGEVDLERELVSRGFHICYFEQMSLVAQLSAIRAASLIVAPHGAGLSNLLSARPGTRVIELLSRNWFNTCYAKMSLQLGLSYEYLDTDMCPDGRYAIPIQKLLNVL